MSSWWSSILDFFLWFRVEPSDKHFAQAKTLYTEFLESNSQDFKALDISLAKFELALSYRRKGKDEPAHPDLDATISTFASAVWKRYERTKSLSDLHKLIELDEEACGLWETIEDPASRPPDHANVFLDLGNAYFNLYLRNSTSSQILEKAITKYKKLTTDTDVQRRRKAFLRLGSTMFSWYEVNELGTTLEKKAERLDQALDYFHRALAVDGGKEILPEGPGEVNQDEKEVISRLAATYYARYNDSKTPSDLEAAIGYNRKARAVMKADDRDYAFCSYDLSAQLFTQYKDKQKQKLNTRKSNRVHPHDADMQKAKDEEGLYEAREVLEKLLTNVASLEDGLSKNSQGLLSVVNKNIDGLSTSSSSKSESSSSLVTKRS